MRKMDRSVWTAALVMMLALALMLPAMAMAETNDQFWARASSGVITLTEDEYVKIDERLVYSGSNDLRIDLNGGTLKLTQMNNSLTQNNTVTILNGTIDVSGIDSGESMISAGDYGAPSGHLILNSVKVVAKSINNTTSNTCGVICVYGSSQLDVINSEIIVENANKGYVIWSQGKDTVVNITDSKIIARDGYSGILDGQVTIKNSDLDLELKDNGINSTAGGLKLGVDTSEVKLFGKNNADGRGLTLDGTSTAEFINAATLDSSDFGEGAIMYKSSIANDGKNKPIVVDNSSAIKLSGKKTFVNKSLTEPEVSSQSFSTYINFGNNTPEVIGGKVIVCRHATKVILNKKDATCTVEGYTGDETCAVCGKAFAQGTAIPKIAHQYAWVIDKEAAAGVAGQKHEACTVCGAKKAPVEIPALPVPALPQTGDTSHIALYALVLAASVMGIYAILRKKESRGA